MLSPNELSILCECAISAAYQAGRIISSNSHRTLDVNKKEGMQSLASSVVTEVDLMSQDKIVNVLKPTLSIFNLALLSEESPDDKSRFEKDYFWCIDPIDGTLPFIESIPGYSVSISLISKEGIPMIGVIYEPLTHNLYYAIQGQGAHKNERDWSLLDNKNKQARKLNFLSDRSFLKHPLYDTAVEKLNDIAKSLGYEGVNKLPIGGGAMNAIWTLEQQPCCYFKFPKTKGGGSLWDYGATACIYNEIGGFASDIYGNTMDLNRKDSTFMNHKGILYTSDQVLQEKVIEMYKEMKG